jgi:hypothetical protein
MTGQPQTEQSRTEGNIRLGLRVSEEERLEVAEQAEISQLTVSEYVQRRILGKPIASHADLSVLAELRRLGGLLKHVHNESRGAYSELTANAIRAFEGNGPPRYSGSEKLGRTPRKTGRTGNRLREKRQRRDPDHPGNGGEGVKYWATRQPLEAGRAFGTLPGFSCGSEGSGEHVCD